MTNITIEGIYGDNPKTDAAPEDLLEGQEPGGDGFAIALKDLFFDRKIVAKTEADDPVAVADTDCSVNRIFTNAGATGDVEFDIPPAEAGLSVSFYVREDTHRITIDVPSGDRIREGANETTSGGTMWSEDEGSFVRITAVDATYWIVENLTGTWNLT